MHIPENYLSPAACAVMTAAMMLGHLTVVGAVEIIFTVSVWVFLRKVSPDLADGRETQPDRSGKIYPALSPEAARDIIKHTEPDSVPANGPRPIKIRKVKMK